jgi:hypothetical protein
MHNCSDILFFGAGKNSRENGIYFTSPHLHNIRLTAIEFCSRSINGFGHGINDFGHGINDFGHGINGFGHGINGFGHGINDFGHGINDFGHGINGFGRSIISLYYTALKYFKTSEIITVIIPQNYLEIKTINKN